MKDTNEEKLEALAKMLRSYQEVLQEGSIFEQSRGRLLANIGRFLEFVEARQPDELEYQRLAGEVMAALSEFATASRLVGQVLGSLGQAPPVISNLN